MGKGREMMWWFIFWSTNTRKHLLFFLSNELIAWVKRIHFVLFYSLFSFVFSSSFFFCVCGINIMVLEYITIIGCGRKIIGGTWVFSYGAIRFLKRKTNKLMKKHGIILIYCAKFAHLWNLLRAELYGHSPPSRPDLLTVHQPAERRKRRMCLVIWCYQWEDEGQNKELIQCGFDFVAVAHLPVGGWWCPGRCATQPESPGCRWDRGRRKLSGAGRMEPLGICA